MNDCTEYTLGFIFDKNAKNVLLIDKIGGPFPGKLNGIGVHLEENENPMIGMMRELTEETGFEHKDIKYIGPIARFSNGNGFTTEDGITVHVFYIILKDDQDYIKVIDDIEGKVSWYNIEKDDLLNFNNLKLADCNIPYFIYYALTLIKNIKE
jgi:ADP-ribose pyrophosphatase YjhB (NUDIX family)